MPKSIPVTFDDHLDAVKLLTDQLQSIRNAARQGGHNPDDLSAGLVAKWKEVLQAALNWTPETPSA